MMSHLLNKGHQLGKDLLFKITQKQVGNGIGSIIASIGIPLILDAIRGKGVGRGSPRMRKTDGASPRIGKSRGGAAPRIGSPRLLMAPPPYIGSRGRGKKKTRKRGQGLLLGKNRPFRGIPLVGDIL